MFAYSGSASFPTYQADMQNKSDFPKAVLLAMISMGLELWRTQSYNVLIPAVLVFLYVPMAATGYFQLGLLADNDGGIQNTQN